MERMSFYIPPVFLFGNKVRHNQEENKTEYKTAMETEIQIENRNIKRIAELEEEIRKLKEDNRFLTKVCKEYMEKENIIEISEFADLYRDDLEKENKKLREKLSAYNRKYFDEDKKVVRMDTSCMEEDTLQELRDLGEI